MIFELDFKGETLTIVKDEVIFLAVVKGGVCSFQAERPVKEKTQKFAGVPQRSVNRPL